jgi:hypothetical protein
LQAIRRIKQTIHKTKERSPELRLKLGVICKFTCMDVNVRASQQKPAEAGWAAGNNRESTNERNILEMYLSGFSVVFLRVLCGKKKFKN